MYEETAYAQTNSPLWITHFRYREETNFGKQVLIKMSTHINEVSPSSLRLVHNVLSALHVNEGIKTIANVHDTEWK